MFYLLCVLMKDQSCTFFRKHEHPLLLFKRFIHIAYSLSPYSEDPNSTGPLSKNSL